MFNFNQLLQFMKTKLTFIIAAMVLAACGKPQIKLTFEGMESDNIVVVTTAIKDIPHIESDSDPRNKIDTIKIENNEIIIPAPEQPSAYTILTSNNDRIFALATPNNRLTYKVRETETGVEYEAYGSDITVGLSDYDAYVRPIMAQINSAPRETQEDFDKINELRKKRNEMLAEWVGKNLNNPASIFILAQYADYETILKFSPQIETLVEKSLIKDIFSARVLEAEKYIAMKTAKESIKEGASAPDFTLNDNNDKPFTLYTLRGKWVVLDFWGTWCGWCIKGMPEMKKSYEKYHKSCEFVSIDCNETKEKWLAGLKKYNMPWVQVYQPTDSSANADVSVIYGIEGYPTKIIITPEGKIHKIFIGETPDFYKELEKIAK